MFTTQNVLLTSENPPTVKVADFGLAKVVDGETFLKVSNLFFCSYRIAHT